MAVTMRVFTKLFISNLIAILNGGCVVIGG